MSVRHRTYNRQGHVQPVPFYLTSLSLIDQFIFSGFEYEEDKNMPKGHQQKGRKSRENARELKTLYFFCELQGREKHQTKKENGNQQIFVFFGLCQDAVRL